MATEECPRYSHNGSSVLDAQEKTPPESRWVGESAVAQGVHLSTLGGAQVDTLPHGVMDPPGPLEGDGAFGR